MSNERPISHERPGPAEARRARSRGRARRRVLLAAMAPLALAGSLAVAPAALAHPLGNFTINHFAAIRISQEAVALDVVIDRAEIPAFQEVQRLDADGDGALGPAELAAERSTACTGLAADLRLAVADRPLALGLVAAGLSTPAGAGGLPTMRLVCEYTAALPAPIVARTDLTFEDRSFAERIGWREIVVLGDRVTVGDGTSTNEASSGAGVSARLTAYPTDLLTRPRDERAVEVEIAPGGPALMAWTAPDATALVGASAHGASAPGAAAPATTGIGVVPGGITEDLAALINLPEMNPIAVLIALAVAFGLGVVHAVSPGHGKTIMAAYLVGGRGSTRQAVGLGLAVAVSHTLGVLVLAVITLAASSVLPPERLYPILGLASGALVIVIGASLLGSRVRAIREERAHARAHAAGHHHEHAHEHDSHEHAHDHGHDHGHPHPHDHAAPADGISWRGLVALGLSGGLVPSASALILLLGSIAAGQPAYGLVLVVAFGIGMAVVLGGIGFALVHARRFVERRPSAVRFERLIGPVQLATASLVVVLGVVLTGQALGQVL
jgi:ABC-type nickel/cobalt efflux system permease component RcnA